MLVKRVGLIWPLLWRKQVVGRSVENGARGFNTVNMTCQLHFKGPVDQGFVSNDVQPYPGSDRNFAFNKRAPLSKLLRSDEPVTDFYGALGSYEYWAVSESNKMYDWDCIPRQEPKHVPRMTSYFQPMLAIGHGAPVR